MVKIKDKKQTPLMKQYNAIKAKHPDALLLFRVGDFYETFGSDAVKTSEILGIVLTKRKNGAAADMELAGFPHHALDTYLPKLVRAGQRVAICDQLEDPKEAKSVVRRGVTELVTPGVVSSDEVLDQKNNNFLAAVYSSEGICGLALLDISTGEFLTSEGSDTYISKLLQNFSPKEVLYPRNHSKWYAQLLGDRFYSYHLDQWVYDYSYAEELLCTHFKTNSLKGFGVQDMKAGIVAAGAAFHYLSETHHERVGHISSLIRIHPDQYVWLDPFTVQNLELFNSKNEGAKTLVEILDRTATPMGSRLLRRWFSLPLKEIDELKKRHEIVSYFLENEEASTKATELLSGFSDIERLGGKLSTSRINPRELIRLKESLALGEPLLMLCKDGCNELKSLTKTVPSSVRIIELITNGLQADPGLQPGKGNVIATGHSSELDELRTIAFSGKDYLAKLQKEECEKTGISSLKIGFNNVFGYYLEVTNAHKDKVPEHWERKQTLVNAERYITAELKEYEQKILVAEEKIAALEQSLYQSLMDSLQQGLCTIQSTAFFVASVDVLLNFAKTAYHRKYCRPTLCKDAVIDIRQGRHPVIEAMLPPGESYVPNDVYLDNERQQIMMITGPNMSGKSALLRQTALITLMAQCGSFVPADQAKIGLVDKIFTRVGASDNISMGESTFMVEMNECANILNNLSPRSLILLDEIGRGTSTYDGISIAWAIAEYIHEHKSRGMTLFATHYHELNDMCRQFKRIKNYNVSVKDIDNKIIFLRKLVPGGTEHSFGIHVARMAGMPRKALLRSAQMLEQLEKQRDSGKEKGASTSSDMQLSFFQLDDPALAQIRDEIIQADINTLTPVEALMKLHHIQQLLGE